MFKFVMTKNSNELFHRAVLHNEINRVRLILEEAMKDPRFNIDEINEEGLTALQFSCFAGNLEIVKILVAYNANIKIRDRDGYTLLHAAAMGGHNGVVKYLLRTSLKPTVNTDDGIMAIDVTDEISTIVILLRSMLDQGYLKEMQDYMMDHPKLKRNIFEELEKVKCREKEKQEILNIPYASHSSPRKYPPNKMVKLKDGDRKGRSLRTFSELSDSMQHLDRLAIDYDTNNNRSSLHEPLYAELSSDGVNTLHRRNSTCSTSSRSSKASRNSTSSTGILRHDVNDNHDVSHRSTQRYLENRYPNPKSVSFNLGNVASHRSYSDGYVSDSTIMSDDYDRRAYSDGYISDNYDENSFRSKIATVPRSSSVSSHSSMFSESCSSFEYHRVCEDQVYENIQTVKSKPNMPTILENHYENLPLKDLSPPPLPPREPTYNSSEKFHSQGLIDRQIETDSGIDINDAAGRMFALSFDERDTNENYKDSPETYSQPIGLYYNSNRYHHTEQDTYPYDAFMKANASNQTKYRSWNGRTLHEATQFAPYASHRHVKDDYDLYNNPNPIEFKTGPAEIYNSYFNDKSVRTYNFDHQPDIML